MGRSNNRIVANSPKRDNYSDSSSTEELRKHGSKCGKKRSRDRSRSKHCPKDRKIMRRKISLYWDVPPPGFEHISTAQYKEMLKSGQVVPSLTPCTRQAVVPVLSASITRQARRLYIGNIPFGVTESEMMSFFNCQLQLMLLTQAEGNPVLACQINLEKNFAFLEFRSIDETTQAMSLEGITFRGQTLKVRRPHDYQPLPGEADHIVNVKPTPTPVPGVISNIVPDSPNKIFIGGLPNFLNEEQIKELLQSFGELRGLNLIKDTNTGLNRGYAFCEYEDPSLTDLAIISLNGTTIGDRKISVQRAISGARNATATTAGSTNTAPQFNPTLLNPADFQFDAATEILCLLNMISVDELDDDEEFDDILSDIKEECEKYGVVRSIEIPRNSVFGQTMSSCKVYVEFGTVFDCQKAQQALAGRKFNGRIVVTSFYDPKKYHRREFQ